MLVQVFEHGDDNKVGKRFCWCEAALEALKPLKLAERCKLEGNPREMPAVPADGAADAVWVLPELQGFQKGTKLKVVIRGNFIRELSEEGKPARALDADHLPPWFGETGYRTGDGIEGGTFESWFIGE